MKSFRSTEHNETQIKSKENPATVKSKPYKRRIQSSSPAPNLHLTALTSSEETEEEKLKRIKNRKELKKKRIAERREQKEKRTLEIKALQEKKEIRVRKKKKNQ